MRKLTRFARPEPTVRRTTLTCLVLLILMAAPVQAQKTIEVEAGPYAITAALESAEVGDVLLLTTDGGIYQDTTLLITKDIVIASDPELDERPTLEYLWEDWSGVPPVNQIIIAEGDLTLRGIKMGNAEADSVNIAINNLVEEPNDIRIQNTEIRNMAVSVLRNATESHVPTVDTLIVTGSYFHNIGNNVIGIKGSGEDMGFNYARIEHTTFGLLDADFAVAMRLEAGDAEPAAQLIVDHVTVYQARQGINITGNVSAEESSVRNSIVANTDRQAFRWRGDEMVIGDVLVWENSAFGGAQAVEGENVIVADPLFADPNAGDFSLQDGSPAIGAATDGGDLGDQRGWQGLVATSAESTSPLPTTVTLRQNSPNPFHTSTTVSFALERTAEVRLDVFNMLGQKVLNVARGTRAAGEHSARIHASDLPAGVYLYRLRVADRTETRKMVLLK